MKMPGRAWSSREAESTEYAKNAGSSSALHGLTRASSPPRKAAK
ncbi:hypothetical protein SCALM49S_10012 [Streptomyces californicus]